MFYMQVANLLVQVNNQYDTVREKCQPYITQADREPDLVLTPSDEDIASTQAWFREHEHKEVRKGSAEYSSASLLLYPQLPAFDAFWLHASVIEMHGEGYAVTAPSGYGKSTQSRLWLQAFPQEARIINGDKPIVRKTGDEFIAYGTPFCGKEGYQVNTGVPLKGLCYLKHGENNSLARLDPTMAFAQLMREYQGLFTPQTQEKYIELLEQFAETVPVYVLTCNQSPEAARVAYEGMKHGGH